MLRWPERARAAVVRLFQPLQDLDIYVEDANDEVFYFELLSRIAPAGLKLARVFSLGNRSEVIRHATLHDFSRRRAIFLVDGDLPWVRGDDEKLPHGVFRLDAYCVENLLVDEQAAVWIASEEAAVSLQEAAQMLDFDGWKADITPALTGLFVAFAVSNALAPDVATVSQGLASVLTCERSPAVPQLDARKALELEEAAVESSVNVAGAAVTDALRVVVSKRVHSLSEPLLAVSGKDFVLPLLDFHLRRTSNCRIRRKTLRLRLARHASPEGLATIRDALARAAWL